MKNYLRFINEFPALILSLVFIFLWLDNVRFFLDPRAYHTWSRLFDGAKGSILYSLKLNFFNKQKHSNSNLVYGFLPFLLVSSKTPFNDFF